MNPPTKIFYVVSLIDKSLSFEWIAARLRNGFRLTFVLMNPGDSVLHRYLEGIGVQSISIHYRGKRSALLAFLRLGLLFLKKKPRIVHTHLFDATLIGLTAAWIARVPKRIYTRHNSTYHHLYFPRAVIFDRWCNTIATHIVSLSQATDHVLIEMEHVSPVKIRKIPHGFDIPTFEIMPATAGQRVMEKWKINEAHPRIGVVSRYIEWKGIQYLIEAFRSFLPHYPQASLLLANASGPYQANIQRLLEGIPASNITQIPFEEDISAIYHLMDLFVHVPTDATCEAFGQAYIEAWIAGVPSILTRSGIAAEVARHNENAWVVDFKDANGILQGLLALWRDEALRKKLARNGKRDVVMRFDINMQVGLLKQLYAE